MFLLHTLPPIIEVAVPLSLRQAIIVKVRLPAKKVITGIELFQAFIVIIFCIFLTFWSYKVRFKL